jgi:hypothetical protein
MFDSNDGGPLPRRAFVAGMLGLSLPDAMARSPVAGAQWLGPQRRGSGWLEWRLDQAPPAPSAQFFDPALFDIWCDFKGPQGQKLRVTAFWDGSHWLLRLLPPVAGAWEATPQGLGRPFKFEVNQIIARQHIGIDAQDPRYFAFDDGSPFVPVGLNICWGSGDGPQVLADYRRWFTRLAANGGNFARLWMASWSFGLEWQDGALGDYSARMDRATQLDAVFELAESLGIKLMLCLINHGAFSEKADAEWQANPYNRAHGGPLAAPEDFVSDARALALFERRVRYIAARWAHSPALHSWEWWNEVTWTPIDVAKLRPWFTRMAHVLDAHDPYRRLRSTSWADRGDAAAWQLAGLDYAQQHDYTTRDPMLHYADAARAWAADGINHKPLLASELGLETTFDAKTPRAFNFDAAHLHNGLWAPLFNGFAATALYWWWDHQVDPLNMWPLYRGVARYLDALHASGLRLAGHHPRPVRFDGGPAQAMALAGNGSVLLWLRADLHDAGAQQRAWVVETGGKEPRQPWQPSYPLIKGGRLHLDGLTIADGPVRVRWFDAGSGEPVASTESILRGGTLELACPSFKQDLAAIVQTL